MNDSNPPTEQNKLRKCPSCKTYTLKDICNKCSEKTISPHKIFSKIRNAPPRSVPFKRK